MRYEALRGLLVHSPQIETGYAEVVIGNPNKVWLELRRLLAERDRAVELLMRAASVVLADEARKQQHHPLSTVARNRPTLASEIMDFLHELEARQC